MTDLGAATLVIALIAFLVGSVSFALIIAHGRREKARERELRDEYYE